MLQLYENIRMLRKALKMSQAELALKTGYNDRSSIAKIEKGEIDLPQSKISLFASALGVSSGELMGNTGILPPAPVLSTDEQDLVDGYRQLNVPGQKQLQKQLSMMLNDDDYRKDTELDSKEAL